MMLLFRALLHPRQLYKLILHNLDFVSGAFQLLIQPYFLLFASLQIVLQRLVLYSQGLNLVLGPRQVLCVLYLLYLHLRDHNV